MRCIRQIHFRSISLVLCSWGLAALVALGCGGGSSSRGDSGSGEDGTDHAGDVASDDQADAGDPSNADNQQGDLGPDSQGDENNADFWSGSYDPNCIGGSSHNVGKNCLKCHDTTFAMGGTVYVQGTSTGAPNVQVGIKDANGFFSTCSGSNGNFYLPISAAIDWASASIRIRNANGEKIKPLTPSAACNTCHTGNNILTAP